MEAMKAEVLVKCNVCSHFEVVGVPVKGALTPRQKRQVEKKVRRMALKADERHRKTHPKPPAGA